MENKQNYYVSVQAGTILPEQGSAAYELEIEATPSEAAKLQELFDKRMEWDDASFIRTHIPAMEYHLDKENDAYDYYMKQIYNSLYELGTDESKRHISSMGVLD